MKSKSAQPTAAQLAKDIVNIVRWCRSQRDYPMWTDGCGERILNTADPAALSHLLSFVEEDLANCEYYKPGIVRTRKAIARLVPAMERITARQHEILTALRAA